MAEVTFPSGAEITAMHVEPWLPGQLVLQSPFTGSVQVLDRGYASWRGSVEIAVLDDEGEDTAQAIEAFFASLMGQGNWCALPLNRASVSASDTATVSAIINASDGTVKHELANALPAEVGHWLAIRDRRFTVRAINATQTEITLDPQVPLTLGDTLGQAMTIRVRSQSVRSQPMRRTPDWWGPWRFDWQEYL